MIFETRNNILREHHPECLPAMIVLAKIYLYNVNDERFSQCADRAIEQSKKVLKDPTTILEVLHLWHRLSHLYRESSQSEKGRLLEEAVIKGREKILGNNHFLNTSALEELARLFEATWRYFQAVNVYGEVRP